MKTKAYYNKTTKFYIYKGTLKLNLVIKILLYNILY